MENIIDIDTRLLLWINSQHTPFWDTVMWYISKSWVWIPLYVFLVWYLITTYLQNNASSQTKPEHSSAVRWVVPLSMVVIAAASAGLSDYITSGILKPLIARPRPTHTQGVAEYLLTVNGYTGGHYGFPSSHAADCWSIAAACMLFQHHAVANRLKLPLPRWITPVVLTVYALLNCYSRMYLGVHYPLDILCGTLIGCLIACLLYMVFFRGFISCAKLLR